MGGRTAEQLAGSAVGLSLFDSRTDLSNISAVSFFARFMILIATVPAI
jgi:hypothetical protein